MARNNTIRWGSLTNLFLYDKIVVENEIINF